MSKESAPAFQFYAADYLADENVQIMSMEEEGCYCRLMAYCWREGSIPTDPELQAKLCKGITPSRLVTGCFKNGVEFGVPNDRLVHPRLELERQKQAAWKEKSALGGKRSAHKRKHPRNISAQQGGSTTVPRVVQPNVNSSSSFSSSISNIPPKPPRGLCEVGKQLNGHCENCQASFEEFWNAYPRHEPSRKQARKAWCKAWSVGEIPPVPDMLRWITRAKLSEQWQDKGTIPHATTWLNQRRWQGDPPPSPHAKQKQEIKPDFLNFLEAGNEPGK